MAKNITILIVVLVIVFFGAQIVIKSMVGSTYESLPFQKTVRDGIEYSLKTIGIPAEVRLSGVSADGWDCKIRSIKMTMQNKSSEIFEITNVRMSPAIWDAIFGGQIAARLTGLFDGQQGTADIIATPGLLDLSGGDIPVLSSVTGSVAGLPKRWISNFLVSSHSGSPRVRFVEGTMDLKGEMRSRTGSLNIKIIKPKWELKIRKRRQVVGEDIDIALTLAKHSMRLKKPAVLRAKLGSISITGGISTASGSPSVNLQVQTKGNRLTSMFASEMFRCGRPMSPEFSVRGKLPKLQCQ